jgi:non-specific serine/threonine protein kinase/serine/threonine-protein kinase
MNTERRSERWRRVSGVLDELLDLPSEGRGARLDELCGEDSALRSEIEALLDADAVCGAFLEGSAVERAAPLLAKAESAAPAVGSLVGKYRLDSELGEGGMGAVFLAARVDGEFDQRVAVKFLKQGFLGIDEHRRFLQERQILAQLQHPSIARLLDGGVGENGVPFFVMEWVDGQPVTAYSREKGLSIEQRLGVFLQILDAVQYAHRNLVVHRDLKPSNILVDREGRVKLLDFGIAKLLKESGGEREGTAFRTAVRAFTPEYAAPEQVRGESVTTATDVYALGVLLFELLAGRGPYRCARGSARELEQAILEEEPRPLSSRALEPRALRRRLRGDLDGIVSKALQKAPERRYVSAEAMAADIRRHLAGLPVTARGDSRVYRIGKFVRRHRIAVASGLVVAFALFGGLVATSWEARRARAALHEAERERSRAERRVTELRRLVNALLFDIHDAIADLPGGTAARKLVASKALEYLDALAGDAGSDPRLQEDLAVAYERLGDAFLNSGEMESAAASYREMLSIRRTLASMTPETTTSRIGLSAGLAKLAECSYLAGDRDGAFELYRESADVGAPLLSSDSVPEEGEERFVTASERLCERLVEAGDPETAADWCRGQMALLDRRVAARPGEFQTHERRATVLSRLIHALDAAGEREEAEYWAEIRTHREPVDLTRHPLVGTWRRRDDPGDNETGLMPTVAAAYVRVELEDGGLRVTYLSASRKPVLSLITAGDGRPVPVLGPDGAKLGTLAIRPKDDFHWESWGDGLPFIYERSALTPDGRIWTSEARMKDGRGGHYTDVDVWEKLAKGEEALLGGASR